MWKETKSREEVRRARNRLQAFFISVVLVACVSVWATRWVVQRMREAAHYTTLDLRQLQVALYIYELKAVFSGLPKYPATLQDLVSKGALSQPDLDRLKAAYRIEYKQPQAGTPANAMLFRAQRKPPIVVYTVSGQNRIETPK